MNHVIVHDPSHNIPTGTIVSEADSHRLRAEGVATLPIQEQGNGVLAAHYSGGRAMAEYGPGIPTTLDPSVPVSPLLVPMIPVEGQVRMHLVAQLVVHAGQKGVAPLQSQLRWTGWSPDQAPGHSPANVRPAVVRHDVPITLASLGPSSGNRGWTVYREVLLEGRPTEAVQGLSLRGSWPGMLVLWAAASQVWGRGSW